MPVGWMLLFTVFVSVSGQQGTFPNCSSGPLSTFPICDHSLAAGERAADLIGRMTIPEKISQMIVFAAAIPRLGLPSFNWWHEALHGVAGANYGGDLPAATSFPMPINLGASFNMSLVRQMGSVISTEARAFNNEGRIGLDFFTPNINIFRDPRWGRGQETPGEDPFLTSEYVYALVDGLQRGEDERYLKIAADCKHYAAYDLENSNGSNRINFNAIVSDQDLVETYLAPFESCIRDARVASIMCSYNSINGIPACAHRFLLQTIARDSFHHEGFVVSDCDAVETIIRGHNYTHTPEETVAAALHAGTDLDCGQYYKNHSQAALDQQLISEEDIDRALLRTFTVLVRLGYFDPAEDQPYRKLSAKDVDTPQSRQLTLEAAQQSLVLLKNANHALPLNLTDLQNKKIALIGPGVNATVNLQGIYYGQAPYLLSPLVGFQNVTFGHSINVSFAFGCDINTTDQSGFAAALDLARSADVVIYIGAINKTIEDEGRDRPSIVLPATQLALIQQLEQVVRSPLHVAIICGSSLDLTSVRDSPRSASLIWMGYPGQSGGLALAQVICGQFNPAGRLPITFYPAEYVNEVFMADMRMRPSPTTPGRTYKFYTGQPVFEFGFGLSYTTFNYTWNNDSTEFTFAIDKLIERKSTEKKVFFHSYGVNVTNTGSLAGDDVVLAFLIPPTDSLHDPSPPRKVLVGFQRVHLDVGQTTAVFFPMTVQSLLTVALDGSKWLEPGEYRIVIGQQHFFTIHLQGKPARWSTF